MAKRYRTNDILTGTEGHVWWNGRNLATVTKFESKLTANFEDVEVCGDPATQKKYTGYSGSGTLTYYKTDTQLVDEMIEAYNNGIMPEIEIITSATNQRTKESGRYKFSDVTVSELTILSFESKKMMEEEVPFEFGSIEILESIEVDA